MIRRSALSVLGILALAGCAEPPAAPTRFEPRSPSLSLGAADAGGTYLVRFSGNGVPASFADRVAALGGEVIFAHAIGIAAVGGLNDAAADQLAGISGVAAVDADAYTTLEGVGDATPEQAIAEPQSPANPAKALRFSRQWNMKTIQADVAWAAGKIGKPSVRVGILDTGIDYLHPDLIGRVDLAMSRSFLSSAENARVQSLFPGAHPIADLNFHGTHVAATVASNAYIYAGVTSNITLVGLKVCTPGKVDDVPAFQATCPTSGTLSAILYAADQGIPIINMSLAGSFARRLASARGGDGPSFLATINRVVNYAKAKGTTIVVAAGNAAMDMDRNGNVYNSYCSATAVICVSATGPTAAAPGFNGPWTNIDALASYSNYGRSSVSVAAPGGNAVPVTAACSGFTIVTLPTNLLVCRNRFFISPTNWSGFAIGLWGTSMASPHTAGVAALIASEGDTSPTSIRSKLEQSADDLGQGGVSPAYGHGRVNAARASGAI